MLRSPLTLSSAGVSREYLEAVTRDAAVMTLNRTPQSLNYWMKSVLEITDPRAYGAVRGDLLKIVEDQRGSSIAQFFTIDSIKVDPSGADLRRVGNDAHHGWAGRRFQPCPRRFTMDGLYNGVSLKLVQFGMVEKEPAKPIK